MTLASVRVARCHNYVYKEPGQAGGLTFRRRNTVTVHIKINQRLLVEGNEPWFHFFFPINYNFEEYSSNKKLKAKKSWVGVNVFAESENSNCCLDTDMCLRPGIKA